MNDYTLPDDALSPTENQADIVLKHYQNDEPNLVRNKIFFSKNAFVFLVDGHKEIHHGDEPTLVTDEQFLLLKPLHCLVTEILPYADKSYQSVLMFFSDKAVAKFKLKYIELLPIPPFSEPPQLINTFNYDKHCLNIRASLISLIQSGVPLTPELLRTKFDEIMLYLLSTSPQTIMNLLNNTKSDTETHFRKVIANNALTNLKVADLAYLCHMSVSTFKRHFVKYYNANPSDWLLAQKMTYAKHLIESNMKPSDIYSLVGYSNLSNFIKAFKAYYEQSPKQYQLMKDLE